MARIGRPGWLRGALARPWDVCLAALAVGLMLPTCWYRYGMDQAVYHYFGTGWIDGLVPYKDAFDVKPPGIYAVYSIATAVFGRNQAAIRIAEMGCVLVTAILAAKNTANDAADVEGAAGICALLLAAWQVTLFGFWDTGQAELWQGASVVAAYVCIRERTDALRLAAGGALAAAGVLFKSTALLSVVVLAGLVVLSGPRRPAHSMRRLAYFTAGFVVPIGATALYFTARGALPALLNWSHYMQYYVTAPLSGDWVGVVGPEMLLARCGIWLGVFAAITGVAFAGGSVANARAPYGELALLASAAAGIVWQRRYFSYHPAVLGPFLVLAAAPGVRRAVVSARKVASAGALFVCAGAFFSSPPWTAITAMNFRLFALHGWWPYVTGKLPESEYSALFDGPFGYSYATDERLAALIESRKPGRSDKLHIRGFDPTAYVLTGLYSPSRFMIETPLDGSELFTLQPTWQGEHQGRLFGASRPRFFVTRVGATRDIEELRGLGYGLIGSRGRHVLLERGLAQSRLEPQQIAQLFSAHSANGTLLGSVSFDATFGADHTVTLDVQGRITPGTWTISPSGAACLTLPVESGDRETCASIYTLDDRYVAIADDGHELANMTVGSES